MKTKQRISKRLAILDSDDIIDNNIDVCLTDSITKSSFSSPPPLRVPFNPITFGSRLNIKDSIQVMPSLSDRKIFDKSIQLAQYKNPHLTFELQPLPPPISSLKSSSLSSQTHHRGRGRPPKGCSTTNTSTFNTSSTKPSIEILYLGPHLLKPWYSSPFPAEYIQNKTSHKNTLFMCERCLKYLRSKEVFTDHMSNCPWIDGPPGGKEIYRQSFTRPQDGDFILMVYELDGRDLKAREYCKRLCLLAKMFLDHKTLYYDVETFLFYLLVEYIPSSERWSLCGYFSKEKMSPGEHNLSCIMTLPHHQKRGFGHFLIDLSYCLTRIEQRFIKELISTKNSLNEDLTSLRLSILASIPEGRGIDLHILGGTPEKPLSDLGLMSYSSYWRRVILRWLYMALRQKVSGAGNVTSIDTMSTIDNDLRGRPMISRLNLVQMSHDTGMTIGDILGTLEHLQAVSWNPDYHASEKGCIEVCIGVESLYEQVKKFFQNDNKTLWVDRRSLIWSPYLSWKG